jgi:hypothetical protein
VDASQVLTTFPSEIEVFILMTVQGNEKVVALPIVIDLKDYVKSLDVLKVDTDLSYA